MDNNSTYEWGDFGKNKIEHEFQAQTTRRFTILNFKQIENTRLNFPKTSLQVFISYLF